MTITFVQRSLIIFAVLLCYYQSWTSAVDCEEKPFDIVCRGSQARKRLVPLPLMRAINCEGGDCRFPRMKFLIAILDDASSRSNEVPFNSESNSIQSRKNRLRLEDSKDGYMDDY